MFHSFLSDLFECLDDLIADFLHLDPEDLHTPAQILDHLCIELNLLLDLLRHL